MENFELFIERLFAKLLMLMLTVGGVGGFGCGIIFRSAHNVVIGVIALALAYMMYRNYKIDYKSGKYQEVEENMNNEAIEEGR